MAKNYHITHNSNGGWKVLGEGNNKPTKILPTKIEAINYGKTFAKNNNGELVIHGLNGKIQDKDSYGKDVNM